MKATFVSPLAALVSAFLLFPATAIAQEYADPFDTEYSDPFDTELEEESIDADYRDPFEPEDIEEEDTGYQDPFAYDDPFDQNTERSAGPDSQQTSSRYGEGTDERGFVTERGNGFDDPFTIGVDERELNPIYDDPFTENVNEANTAPDYDDTFTGDYDEFTRPQR